MVSINIFGDCVCRDSCSQLIKKDIAAVYQYPGFSSTLSLFEQNNCFELTNELDDIDTNNFSKRSIRLDYNKEFLDYIFEKKSDYLLVSLINNRIEILRSEKNTITCIPIVKKMSAEKKALLGFEGGELYSPFEIPIEKHLETVDRLINEILKHYKPEQIIYLKHLAVENWINSKGVYGQFIDSSIKFARNINKLENRLCSHFLSRVSGCHFIDFPENTLGNYDHYLGAAVLHYIHGYYEYVEEAMNIIFQGSSANDEKRQLDVLLKIYSRLFKEVKTRSIACTEKNKNALNLAFNKNIVDFFSRLICDIYGEGKFNNYIAKLKSENKTVSVIKPSSKVGTALKMILEKNDIEIRFISEKSSITALTDSEWKICKTANVIISANIHTNNTFVRDGITEINIKDILE